MRKTFAARARRIQALLPNNRPGKLKYPYLKVHPFEDLQEVDPDFLRRVGLLGEVQLESVPERRSERLQTPSLKPYVE